MVEEANLEFRLGKIDETKNCILDHTKHSDLISQKYKKTCRYLNCVEHLLILASTITGCVPISVFTSLVCVLVGIMSYAVGMKICTAKIKKYKSFIKKKKKKHDKILLWGKDKWNIIEVPISMTLICSYISMTNLSQ